MKYLCFGNPGTIDPLMFKTFGVSVKDSDNPIGFFGTGLKYAIAIILREKGNVTICSGKDIYTFGVSTREVRGKEFNLVTCNDEELGFTTELGKKWEVWMAYRELASNCLDEKGTFFTTGEIVTCDGQTCIFVDCPEMLMVHNHKHSVFITSEPIVVTPTAEIHEGPGRYLFYRGVRVKELNPPSVFTYNLLGAIDLTEDRTVKYDFEVTSLVSSALAQVKNPRVLRKLFTADDQRYERTLSFSSSLDFSDEFVDAARACYKATPSQLQPSLIAVVTRIGSNAIFADISLSSIEKQKLRKAVQFCAQIGFDTSPYEVIVVETLGATVLAMARKEEGQIVISRRVFHQGLKQLCATLIEEVVHLREGLYDHSREMQTFLFDYIATLGEQITGESL